MGEVRSEHISGKQQEPKITCFVSKDPNMTKAFQENKDIYATIASLAFNKSYEECLEFHPETGEYQPEGKARRSEAKVIVLGICYGRSVPSIGQQLYGHDDTMTDEEKTREAQKVYDSVMKAFPNLRKLMEQSQAFAHKYGYVETILGRRRHLPDMTLEEFEFEAMPNYVNPDIDPLDLSTLNGDVGIPERRVNELKQEFSKFKYYGQIVKRTKQLYDEGIRVINNRPKINDAKRQCVNCVDKATEILTKTGWKKYDEISQGEKILSYSMTDNCIVEDEIQEIHVQKSEINDIPVYHLHTANFDAMCTINHRWVMRNFDTDKVRFYETEHLLRFHRPRYHILRMVGNSITSAERYFNVDAFVEKFFNKAINYSDIFNLTLNEAASVYFKIRELYVKNGCIVFTDEELADMFQVVCIMAGKVGNKRCETTEYKYKPAVTVWKVGCPEKALYQTARIDMMQKNETTTDLVWCVTTSQGTWIARREGKYYITGNSIIQGSAADFSKTALINVATDKRWKELGGEVLTIVHDEIVAQAPIDTWEEAAQLLKNNMERAGDFLPFPIDCDVTTSYRWYGLEAPCKYHKPDVLDLENEDSLKWIQYHLVEIGFELPIFKDEDGNKPIGDAAHGVSGKYSKQLDEAIDKYCIRYNVLRSNFLDDIEQRVQTGLVN